MYRFAALGLYGVALGQQAVITSGDIGAIGRTDEDMDDTNSLHGRDSDIVIDAQTPEGGRAGERDFIEVYIAQQAKLLNANSFALGDTVVIRQGASLFNVGYNRWFNQGTLQGEQRTPLDLNLLPSLPTLPTITPGTRDVLVGMRGSLVLDPGSYANVWVKPQGTLTLKPGTYHFKSILVETQAKLLLQGATEIRVQGRLWMGPQAMLGPTPEATALSAKHIRIFVAAINPRRHSALPDAAFGDTPLAAESSSEVEASSVAEGLVPEHANDGVALTAVILAQGSRISANIVSPNGVIWVGQQTTVIGAVIGKWVSVGQQAKLALVSAFEPQRGASTVTNPTDEVVNVDPAPTGENESKATLTSTVYLPFVAKEQ